ncbi:hypothetical protein BT69DRAFT_1328012 [Atractiella rhizophila]|nr:hypothetical protein BT69DRAFT_1328012 [Atractiella rhizophila]
MSWALDVNAWAEGEKWQGKSRTQGYGNGATSKARTSVWRRNKYNDARQRGCERIDNLSKPLREPPLSQLSSLYTTHDNVINVLTDDEDEEEEDLSPYISLAPSPVNSITPPLYSSTIPSMPNSSSQPFPFSQTPTSYSLATSRPVTPPKRSDEEVSPVVSPALKRIRLTNKESAQQNREKLNDYVAKAAQIEQLLQENTFVTHLQGQRVEAGGIAACGSVASNWTHLHSARCIRLWASHFEETVVMKDQMSSSIGRTSLSLPLKDTSHNYASMIGHVMKEVIKDIPPDTRRVVLVSHAESACNAHDGKHFSWVLDGQSKIRKKGQGRGLHQSDFICSTKGRLEEADEQLEYGKNHEGYWNAEKLAEQHPSDTQVEKKFIPVFERLHPGDQALVMFDNSTGHAAIAKDALNTKHMNVGPGGAQAKLRNGWWVDVMGKRHT